MADNKALYEELFEEFIRNLQDDKFKRDLIYEHKRNHKNEDFTYWNNYKEKCKTYTYYGLLVYSHRHKGELVAVTGEVNQVFEHSGNTVLLVDVSKYGEEFSSYYPKNVYVNYKYSDSLQIFEDDIITIYGELNGRKTYTTVYGREATVPMLDGYYAELNQQV